jgi:hypothetical protein
MQYLSSNNPRNVLVFPGRGGRAARPVRRGAALRAALAVLALGAAPWNATAARGQAPVGAGEFRVAELAI